MLFYLLSADELRELFDRLGYPLDAGGRSRATIDYYLARTSHGSTLSAVVHAWVLARADRGQAWRYFLRGAGQRHRRRAGRHDRRRASTWAPWPAPSTCSSAASPALETRDDVLWVDPHWPRSLGPLVLDIAYRGQELTLNVTGSSVTVRAAAGPGRPIRCGSGSTVVTLQPGHSVRLGVRRPP